MTGSRRSRVDVFVCPLVTATSGYGDDRGIRQRRMGQKVSARRDGGPADRVEDPDSASSWPDKPLFRERTDPSPKGVIAK
jgi:hypothetical protein